VTNWLWGLGFKIRNRTLRNLVHPKLHIDTYRDLSKDEYCSHQKPSKHPPTWSAISCMKASLSNNTFTPEHDLCGMCMHFLVWNPACGNYAPIHTGFCIQHPVLNLKRLALKCQPDPPQSAGCFSGEVYRHQNVQYCVYTSFLQIKFLQNSNEVLAGSLPMDPFPFPCGVKQMPRS
jgi:hypothetical protein